MGLEVRRRCGWLKLPPDDNAPPVWARKMVASETCPKSYITAESLGLVEEFLVRQRLGVMSLAELTARQVAGFLILQQALTGEDPQRGDTGRPHRRQDAW